MKIASWNVNSLRVRMQHVCDWLQANQPDLLCLQELKMPDTEFPADQFKSLGYHSAATGQKTYNGVAILSKHELADVVTDLPNFDDPMRRYIAASVPWLNGKHLRIVNVYVPNGQALDSDKFVYKRQWFAALQQAMRTTLNKHENTVLVGDFNITPGNIDVHDPKRWEGKIHCSDTERLMLQKLMSEGLYDTFRQFHDEGSKFSWWDYRGAGYNANEGLRIDLVLSSANMLLAAQDSWIDEAPRKLERPSDHTPVVAHYSA
ncbi:exodeoxyribonuclease III [Arenicella chitinivorans]|uniref:Exodeoxyribonuclease III n=1 Tax=Arenicella chitinivorans TaxID=1329800 RepID=A0A918RT36_9GAMM|nr:exodeoxyribonuclease III [Arenicella chitinivorans]GHA09964.1 exodeoxyribonuclease III [Arenicella chitinivorans]